MLPKNKVVCYCQAYWTAMLWDLLTYWCNIMHHNATYFHHFWTSTIFYLVFLETKSTMLASGPSQMLSALQDIQDLWIPRLSYSLILVGLQTMPVRHHLAEGAVTMLRFVKFKRVKVSSSYAIRCWKTISDNPIHKLNNRQRFDMLGLLLKRTGPAWRRHMQEHTCECFICSHLKRII